jgi:hypothetical protein
MMRLAASLGSFLLMVGSTSPPARADHERPPRRSGDQTRRPVLRKYHPMRNVMSPLIGFAIAIAVVSPAAADWQLQDHAIYFLLVGVAENGVSRLELNCNFQAPHLRGVIIRTGESYDPESSYAPDVPISVTTDGRKQPVINGSFHSAVGDFDDDDLELVVRSDTDIDAAWYKILDAMAASKSTIDVRFYQREYRFSPKGLAAGLRFLKEKCP